jgi:hypothetical protein
MNMFNALEDLMAPAQGFSSYKNALRKRSPPKLPYVGKKFQLSTF